MEYKYNKMVTDVVAVTDAFTLVWMHAEKIMSNQVQNMDLPQWHESVSQGTRSHGDTGVCKGDGTALWQRPCEVSSTGILYSATSRFMLRVSVMKVTHIGTS